MGERRRKALIDKHVPRERRVEGIEEFIIVDRHHGSVERMEQGVLEIGLGVPGGFDGFSSRYPTAKGRVRVVLEPGTEIVEPSSRLDSIDGTIDGEESVLEWTGPFSLFGDAWGGDGLVGGWEALFGVAEREKAGTLLPRGQQ